MFKRDQRKKVVGPQAQRQAVKYLLEEKRLKADRALKLVGMHSSTFYYKQQRQRDDTQLRQKLIELAQARVRWGFPMLLTLVRRDGFMDNHKRVHRIYCEANLQIRKRVKRHKIRHLRLVLPQATQPNQRWSMDFVHDVLSTGRRFRCFNLVDDFTHECILIKVDRSLRSEKLVAALNTIKLLRPLPEEIVCDNGPELISQNMDIWAYQNNVKLKFIQPGKPTQNAFVESFNGKFRNECLGQHWFLSIEEARKVIEEWRQDYNELRPHRSLKMQTPNEFARHYNNMLANKNN